MSLRLVTLLLIALLGSAAPCLAHGDLHELLEKTDRNLQTRPNDVQLLLTHAGLLREHQDFIRALAEVRKVAELAPEMPERLIVEARIRMDLRQWPEAKAALDAYLQRAPASSEAFFLRSKVLAELGETSAAMEDARATIKHQAKASLPYHLHIIELTRRFGTAGQVAECFANARMSLGKLPALLETQAAWLVATGDRQAAAGVYGELREAVPALAFHTWLAELEIWTGHDPEKARHARAQAELTWNKLPDRMRQRTAMIEKHNALTRNKTHEP